MPFFQRKNFPGKNSFGQQKLVFFHQLAKKSQSELFFQLKTKSGIFF